MKNKERSQDHGVVRSRGVATTVLMVATFMDLMDSTITNVALPTIGKNLGATPEQLEWTGRWLRHRVRDPTHHRWETGRHLWAPAYLRDRNRGIHSRLSRGSVIADR